MVITSAADIGSVRRVRGSTHVSRSISASSEASPRNRRMAPPPALARVASAANSGSENASMSSPANTASPQGGLTTSTRPASRNGRSQRCMKSSTRNPQWMPSASGSVSTSSRSYRDCCGSHSAATPTPIAVTSGPKNEWSSVFRREARAALRGFPCIGSTACR